MVRTSDARAGRPGVVIRCATAAGVLLAGIGVIDGVVMGLHKKVTACPTGHHFPEGTTDFTCYTHPQAGGGIAIIALSALLGLVVVFTAISAVQLCGETAAVRAPDP